MSIIFFMASACLSQRVAVAWHHSGMEP